MSATIQGKDLSVLVNSSYDFIFSLIVMKGQNVWHVTIVVSLTCQQNQRLHSMVSLASIITGAVWKARS